MERRRALMRSATGTRPESLYRRPTPYKDSAAICSPLRARKTGKPSNVQDAIDPTIHLLRRCVTLDSSCSTLAQTRVERSIVRRYARMSAGARHRHADVMAHRMPSRNQRTSRKHSVQDRFATQITRPRLRCRRASTLGYRSSRRSELADADTGNQLSLLRHERVRCAKIVASLRCSPLGKPNSPEVLSTSRMQERRVAI